MRKLNNRINLDRANRAADNISPGEKTMRNSSKKTPWHLRFAPGAILRIVSKAGSLASAILQPVRQRLNQWNWRKKTALVTALAITAGSTFYYQRAHAAAFLGPILATKSGDFFVKFFVGYALNKALEAAFAKKLQKTADATPDGEPLYSNREFYERRYSFDDSGTQTEDSRIDAKADALYHKAYNTTGTDSILDPTTLDQREVLDHVSDNANLNGTTDTHQILENGEPLYTWTRVNPRRYIEHTWYSWGGYVQKPTDEEIQEDLDLFRDSWNASFQDGSAPGRRPARLLGPLTLGPKVSQVDKRFVCDKEVRLWSKFKFNRIAGDTSANPRQLQTPGDRPNYVTELSYYAREAGYRGYIVTKVPQNEEPFFEYPEPRSYNNHSYLPQQLDSIIWANYKITEEPTWIGSATRYFNSKSAKWCKRHNVKFNLACGASWFCKPKRRYEYKLFQNESVKKPSN